MYYVFLAEGFEEAEALIPVDVMRRAGIEVYTVGVGYKTVTGSHLIPVTADVMDCEIAPDEELEGVILPGGMPGTVNLENSKYLENFINYAAMNGKLLAAICAAPSILGKKGLLSGKKAVCFPGFEDKLLGADVRRDAVCTDGNIITACGAGKAMEFALEIVKYIKGAETANHFKENMLCDR